MYNAALLLAVFVQVILTVWCLHLFFSAMFDSEEILTIADRVVICLVTGACSVLGTLLCALTISHM